MTSSKKTSTPPSVDLRTYFQAAANLRDALSRFDQVLNEAQNVQTFATALEDYFKYATHPTGRIDYRKTLAADSAAMEAFRMLKSSLSSQCNKRAEKLRKTYLRSRNAQKFGHIYLHHAFNKPSDCTLANLQTMQEMQRSLQKAGDRYRAEVLDAITQLAKTSPLGKHPAMQVLLSGGPSA